MVRWYNPWGARTTRCSHYWPKWKEFKHLPPEEVRRVQELLNNRPRKVLGYRTPSEAFRAG